MIKLSDALERIKQECLHNDCPHCPFDDGADGCLLTDANVIPCEWDFSVMRNADAAPTTSDNVNHPSHYTQGGVECIDALQAATVNLQGIEAVCTANAIKYLWRWKQFQSTLPRGSDPNCGPILYAGYYFNPRSLAGAT